MNVGFSIPIHQDSKSYINDTLSQYKEVSEQPYIVTDPIIHMYAEKDTLDVETGELRGYIDSLFCRYHFYNPKERTVYKSRGRHDGLWFGVGVSPSNVKIFKDGSTMICLKGEYEIMIGTSVHVYCYRNA